MKKEEFEQDMTLLKEKAPHVYHDIARITSPFFRVHAELHTANMQFLDEHFGVSLNELDILTSLFYSGGETHTLSPTQLMERLLFSSGGMTKILKKLEHKGLICRLDTTEDKRSKLVQLTPQGNVLAQKGLQELFISEAEYFSALSEEEKVEFSRLLLKVMKK